MSDDAHRQRIFSPFGKVAQLSGTSLSQADAHMQHYSIADRHWHTHQSALAHEIERQSNAMIRPYYNCLAIS
jgi:hypothetical protein